MSAQSYADPVVSEAMFSASGHQWPHPYCQTRNLSAHPFSMSTKTQTPLAAFHGQAKIKRKYVARIRAHRKADDIISGQYWEKTGERMRGCAVGCTLHSSDHGAYETELGIPRVLAKLEDRIFEGLWGTSQRDAAKDWPLRFLSAPKVGADLSMVWPRFAHWLLIDPDHGVINFTKRKESKEAILRVASLYERWIGGDKPASNEFKDAATYAYAAYAYAAAASDADAAYAAYAAADAAADAAYYAAASDAAAYAYAAAYVYFDAAAAVRGKRLLAMSEKLLELMASAPVLK